MLAASPIGFQPGNPQRQNNDQRPCMNKLDAAQALLQVCPSTVTTSCGPSAYEVNNDVVRQRPRGNSLDELAELASKQVMEPLSIVPPITNSSFMTIHSSSCSSDEDSEIMPPPPPRIKGRARSVSNPEGMEKWDSLSQAKYQRRHFVLPSSILEEELAEAKVAVENMSKDTEGMNSISSNSLFGTSPNSVASPMISSAGTQQKKQPSFAPDEEANLGPAELLRRARSRLLEDLSEGSLHGEKGMLTLPHSLAKYKEVYNKNGRIGIYTPSERAAIIQRFNLKRSRRVWNKKIRYNCRKNLADRRLRVKGRFVKRAPTATTTTTTTASSSSPSSPPINSISKTTTVVTKTKTSTKTISFNNEVESFKDQDMPDVNDPEAGFVPTEDQPYRRLRRHTIT